MTDDFIRYGIIVGGRDAADPTEIAAIFIAYYMGQGSIKPIILLNSLKNGIEQQEGALEFIKQYIDFFRQWASRRTDGDKELLQEIDNYIKGLYEWLKQGKEKGQLDDIEHQRLKAQKKSITEKLYDHIPERLVSGGQTSIEQLLNDIQNYEYVRDRPPTPSFKWQNGEIERLGLIYEEIQLLMRLIKKIYSECATKYHYLHYLDKILSDIVCYTGVLEISRDKYDWNRLCLIDNNIEEYWKILDNDIEEYKRRFYRQHLPELKEYRRELREADKTDQKRLQEIISALKRYKESGDKSAWNDASYYSDDERWEDLQKVRARFPPIRSLSDLLYKYKDQCTEKTVDVIIQLKRAVRHGAGYHSELLDNLSSDEVLEDLEKVKSYVLARTENGKAHKTDEKPEEIAPDESEVGPAPGTPSTRGVLGITEAIQPRTAKPAKEIEEAESEDMIFIDLKSFNKGPSLNLLTDLLADRRGDGVTIDKEEHGKKQPQSLRDVLKNNGYESVAEKVTSKKGTVFLNIPFKEITTDPQKMKKNNPA